MCLILIHSLSYYRALTCLEPFLLGYNCCFVLRSHTGHRHWVDSVWSSQVWLWEKNYFPRISSGELSWNMKPWLLFSHHLGRVSSKFKIRVRTRQGTSRACSPVEYQSQIGWCMRWVKLDLTRNRHCWGNCLWFKKLRIFCVYLCSWKDHFF